jgi:hypothetical protein
MDNQSPYNTLIELPREGLIKQELTTYEIKDGMLRKITVCRHFTVNDYDDSQTIEPLCKAKMI